MRPMGNIMDEDSVGILGVLLIVTALVMSQTVLHGSYASPSLPDVKWANLIDVFGCSQPATEGCTLDASATR